MEHDLYEKIILAIFIMALIFCAKTTVITVHDESRFAKNQQQFSIFSLTIYHKLHQR